MSFYDSPPAFCALQRKSEQLLDTYPYLRRVILGKSFLGRPIYGFLLGNENRKNLMAGAFHGQEWLTASLLIRFLEDLCRAEQENLEKTKVRLAEKGLIIIPMVNPDGCEIALFGPKSAGTQKHHVEEMKKRDSRSWQANARGVDLNHNFDAGFSQCRKMERQQGILSPGPRQHGGPYPHSEPETRAVVRACEDYRPDCVFAFHSQGEELFYQYGQHTPKESEAIAQKLSLLSGYERKTQSGLASHGGFKDWFIEAFHRPGFTIEVGKGENPLPIADLPGIYQKLKPAMYFMCGV